MHSTTLAAGGVARDGAVGNGAPTVCQAAAGVLSRVVAKRAVCDCSINTIQAATSSVWAAGHVSVEFAVCQRRITAILISHPTAPVCGVSIEHAVG